MITREELDVMSERANHYDADWRDVRRLVDEVRTLGRVKADQLHELRNEVMRSGRHIDFPLTDAIHHVLPTQSRQQKYIYFTYEQVEMFRSAYAQLLSLTSLLANMPVEAVTVDRISKIIFESTRGY